MSIGDRRLVHLEMTANTATVVRIDILIGIVALSAVACRQGTSDRESEKGQAAMLIGDSDLVYRDCHARLCYSECDNKDKG